MLLIGVDYDPSFQQPSCSITPGWKEQNLRPLGSEAFSLDIPLYRTNRMGEGRGWPRAHRRRQRLNTPEVPFALWMIGTPVEAWFSPQ